MPYHDGRIGDDPRAALRRLPTVAGFARGLAAAGWAVRAVHLFPVDAELDDGGIRHRFLRPPLAARLAGRLAHAAWPRHGAAYWQLAPGLARAALDGDPAVVHAFGMTMDWQLAPIRRAIRRAGARSMLHYHGGLPDGDALTRRVRAANLRAAARVLFTHRAQAEPWIRAGLIDPEQLAELPETSTDIAALPRAQAGPGLRCLMVGRLHPVKAPLVALDAFERVAAVRPDARLDVVGADEGLGEACRRRVASSPLLAPRTVLHGAQPREAMPGFYAGADVLLHASAREWCSLAVLEALACGVVPCAVDQPSMRALTDGGRVGRLVPAGDAAALAAAVLDVVGPGLEKASRAAARHFEERLSFGALGRRLAGVYEDGGA